MASNATGSKLLKKKNLPYFELDVYSTIALSDLVIYSIYSLQKQGSEITTENVVFTCFGLFPHKFSLKNYTRWPDSALVARRLSDCKDRGTLKGNSAQGFLLTYKGLKLAERVAKQLGVYVPEKKPAKKLVSSTVKKLKKKKIETPEKKIKLTPRKLIGEKKTASAAPKPAFKQLVKMQMKKVQPETPNKAVISKKQVIEELPKIQVKKAKTKAVKKSTVTRQVQKINRKPKVSIPVKLPDKKLQPELLADKSAAPIKGVARKSKILIPTKLQGKKQKSEPVKKTPAKQAKEVTQLQLIPVAVEKKSKPPQPKKILTPTPSVLAAPSVSKEEKARAGKFMQMMEKSDAYKHYQKDGIKTKISEFDFRSMLLATMESSAETLVRNLGLFTSYAHIQNRQDLVTFLSFCEKSFSSLLNSSDRKTVKKK